MGSWPLFSSQRVHRGARGSLLGFLLGGSVAESGDLADLYFGTEPLLVVRAAFVDAVGGRWVAGPGGQLLKARLVIGASCLLRCGDDPFLELTPY